VSAPWDDGCCDCDRDCDDPARSIARVVVLCGDDDAAVAAMTTPPLYILDVPLVDDAEIVVVAP
jgi:hypothetical protein